MKHVALTIEEAAAWRGVSRTMIYPAIARRKLPRRYAQGRLVVREMELLAWQVARLRGGFPAGKKQSAIAKAKISRAQKQRWAKRRQEHQSRQTQQSA